MLDPTITAVRNPVLSLTAEQLSTSDALSTRLQRVHRFCDAMHAGTGIRLCSRLARSIAEQLLPPLEGRVLTPTIYGFKLCVSRQTGNNYYYQGFYEPGTLAVMKRFLRPGDVFIDAGASVGLMSMMASTLVGRDGLVFAFEPHPGRFQELTNSVAANQASNVLCLEAGLGDEARTVSLYTDRVSPSMVVDASRATTSTQTAVLRLDDVLAAHGVGRARMMKIDVEGYELKVLEGAEKLLIGDEPPVLCVEHGVYGDEPFLPYIASLGRYQFYQLERTKAYDSKLVRVDDFNRMRRHDNVFCVPAHQLAAVA